MRDLSFSNPIASSAITWEDFFALRRFGMTLGLDNIQLFCERLQHPERSFPCVHVGGTNGKGTVVSLLDSILRQAGFKVGMYTSPHLLRFEERIRVNGHPIAEREVFSFLEQHWDFIQKHHCTFFEVATAMALDYFREERIDIAVVEVGLGGTFDSTQVINSCLAVITRVDYDHMDRLGSSLTQIAAEKAGIFREGKIALTANQYPEVLDVLDKRAREIGADLVQADNVVRLTSLSITPGGISGTAALEAESFKYTLQDWHLPLTGVFQTENLKAALAATCLLPPQFKLTNSAAISRAINGVSWPGRLQEVRREPFLILDVGHNPGAVKSALASIRLIWKPRRIIAIFSALRDKDVAGMLSVLKAGVERAFIVPLAHSRGMDFEEVSSLSRVTGWKTVGLPSVDDALSRAWEAAEPSDLILVIGSHYLVQEVLKNKNYS